jgi:drug/metabolite transporter (DMT)-like permease
MTRKKPTANQILASVLCLLGCFVLSGVKINDLASIGIGNILCGLAGILAGIYVVFLSVYGRDLNLMLYMVVYMTVYFLESALMAVVLNFVKIGGVPMESIVFSLNPVILILSAVFGLISVGICWLLRTEAGTHLNPVKVSLILPLSTIISGVVSVICGYDKLTVSYVVGAVLIILSILIMEMRRPQKLK